MNYQKKKFGSLSIIVSEIEGGGARSIKVRIGARSVRVKPKRYALVYKHLNFNKENNFQLTKLPETMS